MSPGTSRRHHTVPRFYLRGFASDDGLLHQTDLVSGRRAMVSVNDATVVKDFYSITLPDGSRSDLWEHRLGEVEATVAPILRDMAQDDAWGIADGDRAQVSVWMALQYLRGPDNRRMIANTRSLMVRMQVGMGGLAYLHHVMSQAAADEVPKEDAERVWNDIHKPGGPTVQVSSTEHLSTITYSIEEAAQFLVSRNWHRVHFERRTLTTNDSPVALLPADDHPEVLGVGLMNAGAVTIALDRRTLLMINGDGYGDTDLPPSTAAARVHNSSALFGAARFVYTHPDDAALHDEIRDLPRGLREFHEPDNLAEFANRERSLETVLEQIEEHRATPQTPGSLIADYTWPIPGYVAPPGVSV